MINNYIDRRNEQKEPYFSKMVSLLLIFGTGGASMLLGIWLTALYGLPVLVAGAISFGVGIFYSFTSISISHTPYGEIAIGINRRISGHFPDRICQRACGRHAVREPLV